MQDKGMARVLRAGVCAVLAWLGMCAVASAAGRRLEARAREDAMLEARLNGFFAPDHRTAERVNLSRLWERQERPAWLAPPVNRLPPDTDVALPISPLKESLG